MSRRRRASSVTSRGDDDDVSDADHSNPAPPPSSRKKKKLEPAEICRQLYDIIRTYRKEDGSLLCDSFIRAPKRRQEPAYYEIVSQPIDLLRVQQKLKTEAYEDIEELSADIELLINNSKAFYKPDSVEYKDAESLWDLYNKTKMALESGEEVKNLRPTRAGTSRRSIEEADLSETSTNNDDDNIYEELFSCVMAANMEGRSLYPAFQFLPSKKLYPEYYEVIDYPIDLKIIAGKIQAGEYLCLNDMEKDLMAMCRNACSFNEPGSQIYKDAKALKKIIQLRKQEIEKHIAAPCKSSERIRSKRVHRVAGLSSAAVALMDPADHNEKAKPPFQEEETDESDEEKGEDTDSPQWKLLDAVRSYPGSGGTPMSEPFLRLPSKKFYPDYYRRIKNSISLNQIRTKIRRGAYGTLSEVAGDLNIMFENAKNYNEPTSKLYRDAVKLQRVMQQTVARLLDVEPSSSDDETLALVKTPRPRGRPKAAGSLGQTNLLNSTPVANPKGAAIPLRKRLHALSKHLMELTCSDGRKPMLLFMEKPSKKLYPDYYNVISNPIDMITIENNIKSEQYKSVEELVADLRLMFNNCREYNEEGSMVYEDADILERAMNEKLRELQCQPQQAHQTPVPEKKTPFRVFGKMKTKNLTPTEQKLRTLYETIRDYRDPKGNRQLSQIFMKLPNKNDYPDYYELIKNPIDMDRIYVKMRNSFYQSVNEMSSDFILMFDNACKYNEPDSQIYKDALLLHKITLQTKQQLRGDEDAIPDVTGAVQELLLTLFTSVYNHQDAEGRCYSDSMSELPEHESSTGGGQVRAISLDLVKRRLDRNLYKRIDHFQQDMFAVFERARRLSRTDSQIFEDSIELQSYYIQQRDELCKDVLSSPALSYTRENMTTAVELVRQCKLLQENTDEDETRSSCDDSLPPSTASVSQTQYNKGDFLYVSGSNAKEPNIVQVERVWTDSEGNHMIYANVYYRPEETFHVRTRRFLQREVFKTETHKAVPMDQVLGRCFVCNVKDYFKYKPRGYADKDVYVCESRYNSKTRSFKKIKMWDGSSTDSDAVLVPRDVPLEPTRTVSVFEERLEKHRDELAELECLENIHDQQRPDVVIYNPLGTDDDNTYYEQYNTVCGGCVKLGDFVYVVSDGGKQVIAQIDSIWETKDGKCYFRGPFLMFPSEVSGVVQKPFYKQEVLLTNNEETCPLVSIVGRCAVLAYDDYLKLRPTEVTESDVWVCECELRTGSARRLTEGLKVYRHSREVTQDEIYFFPRRIGPPELTSTPSEQDANTLGYPNKMQDTLTSLINTTVGPGDVDSLLENSMDDSPAPTSNTHSGKDKESNATTPGTTKKKKEPGKKLVTGYILYSSEVRKAISANNPESTFGEISRIVGNEWRSLPEATKQSWEERAAKCNEETKAKIQEEMSQLAKLGLIPPAENVFECLWDTCDYQFEDLADCVDHCIGEGGNPGHIQQHYKTVAAAQAANNEYSCLWRNCNRLKKQAQPFPNMPRLLRHIRDLHINKGNGRQQLVDARSKNFIPSTKKAAAKAASAQRSVANTGTPLGSPQASGQVATLNAVGGGLEPLFVAPPPRPQMVKHSEAYIRYIEGLHTEQKYITPWEKTLQPVNIDTNMNIARLPTHWLNEEAVTGYLRTKQDVHALNQDAKLVTAIKSLADHLRINTLYIQQNL